MGRNFFSNSSFYCSFWYHISYPDASESHFFVIKDFDIFCIIIVSDKKRFEVILTQWKIFFYVSYRIISEKYDSEFSSLSTHGKLFFRQINIISIESHEFWDSQSRRIDHFHNGKISNILYIVRIYTLKKWEQFFFKQKFYFSFFVFYEINFCRGKCFDFLFLKILEKGSHGNHIRVSSFCRNAILFMQIDTKIISHFESNVSNFYFMFANSKQKILKFCEVTHILFGSFWRFIFDKFQPIYKIIFCFNKLHIFCILKGQKYYIEKWKNGSLFHWNKSLQKFIFYYIVYENYSFTFFPWKYIK